MITAITAQILDANNYNISPAVNVESIYFERVSDDGTTQRMSLRNRTIVAGDTINLNGKPVMPINSVKEFSIPYVYFSNVGGTSDSTGRIIQANADLFPVGEELYSALMNDVADRISFDEAKDMYLSRKDLNYVEERIRVGQNSATSGIVISRNSGKPYISFNNDKLMLSVNGSNTSVYVNNNLDIVGSTVNIHYGNSDYGIQMKSNTTTVDDKNIKIGHESSTNGVIGSKISIKSSSFTLESSDLTIRNDASISLVLDSSSIKLNASHTFIYGKEIEHPSLLLSDVRKDQTVYLCLNKSGDESDYGYYWKTTPTLTIYDSGDDTTNISLTNLLGNGNTTIYQGHLYTTELSRPENLECYNLIGDSINNGASRSAHDVYVKSIKSGSTTVNVIRKHNWVDEFSDSDNSISFVTINGKSIIGTDNISIVKPDDIISLHRVQYLKDVDETQQQYKIFGGSYAQINTLNNPRSANETIEKSYAVIQYSDMVYYKGNGALYASNYYSNSDARLKTDIQDINPEDSKLKLHSFVWKKSGLKSYGFIAQEVEETHPELVDTDENGLKKVDNNAALSYVVGQQQIEINELKNEIAYLKSLLLNKDK